MASDLEVHSLMLAIELKMHIPFSNYNKSINNLFTVYQHLTQELMCIANHKVKIQSHLYLYISYNIKIYINTNIK